MQEIKSSPPNFVLIRLTVSDVIGVTDRRTEVNKALLCTKRRSWKCYGRSVVRKEKMLHVSKYIFSSWCETTNTTQCCERKASRHNILLIALFGKQIIHSIPPRVCKVVPFTVCVQFQNFRLDQPDIASIDIAILRKSSCKNMANHEQFPTTTFMAIKM